MGKSLSLIQLVDAFSTAPARVGTLVRVIMDVTDNGRSIWYQKQYRSPGEKYVVWRKIASPEEDDLLGADGPEADAIDAMLGNDFGRRRSGPTILKESGTEDRIKWAEEMRPGITVRRVWEDEI